MISYGVSPSLARRFETRTLSFAKTFVRMAATGHGHDVCEIISMKTMILVAVVAFPVKCSKMYLFLSKMHQVYLFGSFTQYILYGEGLSLAVEGWGQPQVL